MAGEAFNNNPNESRRSTLITGTLIFTALGFILITDTDNNEHTQLITVIGQFLLKTAIVILHSVTAHAYPCSNPCLVAGLLWGIRMLSMMHPPFPISLLKLFPTDLQRISKKTEPSKTRLLYGSAGRVGSACRQMFAIHQQAVILTAVGQVWVDDMIFVEEKDKFEDKFELK